ncbi:inositol 2-dehydrogenase [soil metagenome]
MGRHHAHNLAGRVPSAELVRVADAAQDIARRTGEEVGVDWSTDFDDLCGDPDIEGVVIATPTPLHADMIEQAARAGKHVFCEKPIAFDADRTLHAVDAAHDAGVKLQIGFHRRFDPDWAAARSRIEDGQLGDVYLFRTSLRDMQPPGVEYIKSSGGFFVDVTIHDLDTARWLVGEIEQVAAFGAALSDPSFAEVGDIDNAVVVLRFVGGGLGVIDNSRVAGYGYECSTEVMGSRATVRIGDHRRRQLRWLTAGECTVDHVSDFMERYPQAYRDELEDFAAAVRDDREVRVTGDDGLAALRLCQAAQRSWELGRPVALSHTLVDGRPRYEIAG